MKNILLLLTLLILPATARLGETPTQCQKRYGKPLSVNKKTHVAVYQKAGFRIAILFWKGKSHQLFIAAIKKDALGNPVAFSKTQLKALLTANLGENYEKMDKTEIFYDTYGSKDTKRFAKHDTMKNRLFFSMIHSFPNYQINIP